MYYFIFEYPRNRQLVDIARQVEDEIVNSGIAGEIIELTPARNVDTLLSDAHRKGYQTLVVVGSSKLVNEVAARLLRYEMVLGVVPLGPSKSLSALIHCETWQEAVTALRRRRWIYSAMARIEDKVAFLSPASLQLAGGKQVTIKTKAYQTTVLAQELTVAPTSNNQKQSLITVSCNSKLNSPHTIKDWWQDIRRPTKTGYSVFRQDSITITSDEGTKLAIDDLILARSPITVSVIPKALRLIVAKNSSSRLASHATI